MRLPITSPAKSARRMRRRIVPRLPATEQSVDLEQEEQRNQSPWQEPQEEKA
jgi:hypothetical protein